MTETTIQKLTLLQNTARDDFERRLFAALLACAFAQSAAAKPAADETEPEPNITLPEERCRRICLTCPLPDCVGNRDDRCPIQIEQRRV